MGATKRLCEMIIQAMDCSSDTHYAAVRFGNVLGSNGSVIPLFKKQLASGGPLKVTHREVTRFFMTIPEAAQLVLQAATYARGGEIFVLDMGEPVKIYDLAEKLIRLSGLEPHIDINIEITGLRPGEKLYEELLMADEGLRQTSHSKIFIAKPAACSMDQLEEQLQIIEEVIKVDNDDEVKKALSAIVPTYQASPKRSIS